MQRLDASAAGIICLTPENVDSPWLLFEAGALARKQSSVYTFLLDVTQSQVPAPLTIFQHTLADKSDVARLLRTINDQVRQLGENALGEQALARIFDKYWPDLEARLQEIAKQRPGPSAHARTEKGILEEILSTVRGLDLRQASIDPSATVEDVRERLAREAEELHDVDRMLRDLRGLLEERDLNN